MGRTGLWKHQVAHALTGQRPAADEDFNKPTTLTFFSGFLPKFSWEYLGALNYFFGSAFNVHDAYHGMVTIHWLLVTIHVRRTAMLT